MIGTNENFNGDGLNGAPTGGPAEPPPAKASGESVRVVVVPMEPPPDYVGTVAVVSAAVIGVLFGLALARAIQQL